jgi:hypothetical protein
MIICMSTAIRNSHDRYYQQTVGSEKGFGKHWHTQDDNMKVIDPNTLGIRRSGDHAFVYNSSKTPI